MDLLRAAIIGPKGTPYHDGLFFFDAHFTSDYPSEPQLYKLPAFLFMRLFYHFTKMLNTDGAAVGALPFWRALT